MSGGFFRGTSAEQDTRFSNKQAKLLKTQKFAPELEHLVDAAKVKMDVVKPWIAKRVTELLGFEDEVLINFIYGLLEGKEINGKQVQIQLTGFMEKNTGKFMRELWALLLSAQKNASGVPQQFLDAKEEETRKKKAETDRIFNEIQQRKEKETKEFEHERLRKTDGGLDENSAEELDRRAGRGPETHSGDENGAGVTNGFRGRKRSSKSPYSSDRSPSPRRIGRSRSVSRSYSNSRSYSKERSISRSISESPRGRRRPISPERMNRSPRRRSATPRRRSARESISPRRRSHSGRRSSSYARKSPSPMRHRVRSPLRRRSPSPARRRSSSLARDQSPSPVRRRSRTPLRRRSRSPRWRRSPSPRRRYSPSARRRRSPSPRRRRSPSPFRRRRSPSPVRWRRSPSPVRQRRQRSTSSSRSRSPVQHRRLSPVRRRYQSPVRRRSPIPARRRSPSPDQSWSLSSGGPRSRSPVRRRSPSPVRRRSPVPARRRSPASAHRRSPTPLSSRSRSPASQSPALPIRHGSVSPVRMKSRRLLKSPPESPGERNRNQEPAVFEPTMMARKQPISLSPQRDHSDRNRSRRKLPSVSPSPEKSSSYIESPQTRTRLSDDRRLASPYESPGKRALDQRTRDGSQSPPSKLRGQRSRHACPVRSVKGLPNSREDEENKCKVTKRESPRSSGVKNRFSPDKPVSHRHHDNTDPRDEENEMRSGEVNMKEVRSSKKSPHKSSLSGERHDASYPGVVSMSDDKRSIYSKDGRDNCRSGSLENIDKKVKRRSPSVESDSGSEESDKPKAGIGEKRKNRRSSHREAADDTSSESELENRRETKRRRKEEKKIRKEERRRRREEKRRRREEKRASKRKRKSKGADMSSSDMEKRDKDVNASNGEPGSRKYSSEDEETESQKKRLEIELREKALESLRAKKGISR